MTEQPVESNRLSNASSSESPTSTSRSFWQRKRVLIPIFLLGLSVLFYVFHPMLLPFVATWLNVGEAPRKTDYVMLLSGGYETRPFVAAALIKAGFAAKVLTTYVPPTPAQKAGLTPSNQEIIRAVLLHQGLKPDQIIQLPGDCVSTFDEAKALKTFLKNDSAATITIVTHHYHTRRSRFVFEQVLPEKASQFYFVSAPVDDYTEQNWWINEHGFVTYCKEYSKFVYYVCRYGNGLWYLTGAAIVLVGVWFFWKRRKHQVAVDSK